jgi:hypothetical protein
MFHLALGIAIGVLLPIVIVVLMVVYTIHQCRASMKILADSIPQKTLEFSLQIVQEELTKGINQVVDLLSSSLSKQDRFMDLMLKEMGDKPGLPPTAQEEVNRLERMLQLPDEREDFHG